MFKVYSKEAECRAIIVKFNPRGLKDEYIDSVSCVCWSISVCSM